VLLAKNDESWMARTSGPGDELADNRDTQNGGPSDKNGARSTSKHSLLINGVQILSWMSLGSVTYQSVGEDDPPSSGGSGDESDYGNSREKALKQRALRCNRGRSVSDTEDEDQEAEDQMNSEVVPESDAHHRHRAVPKAKTKSLSAKQKGKQRATDPTDSAGEDEDGNGDDDEEMDDNSKDDSHPRVRYVTGPLSEEAQEEVQKLGEETKARADDLARKYRKSPGVIMRMAGLGVQNARQRDNIANKHKTWYSHYHPKPDTSE